MRTKFWAFQATRENKQKESSNESRKARRRCQGFCNIRGWNYGIIHSMLVSLVQLPLATLIDQPMLQNQTPEKQDRTTCITLTASTHGVIVTTTK